MKLREDERGWRVVVAEHRQTWASHFNRHARQQLFGAATLNKSLIPAFAPTRHGRSPARCRPRRAQSILLPGDVVKDVAHASQPPAPRSLSALFFPFSSGYTTIISSYPSCPPLHSLRASPLQPARLAPNFFPLPDALRRASYDLDKTEDTLLLLPPLLRPPIMKPYCRHRGPMVSRAPR